jgi:hypothetical protein
LGVYAVDVAGVRRRNSELVCLLGRRKLLLLLWGWGYNGVSFGHLHFTAFYLSIADILFLYFLISLLNLLFSLLLLIDPHFFLFLIKILLLNFIDLFII